MKNYRPPKRLSNLKVSWVNYILFIRYIPNLAQTAAALQTLLKNAEKNRPINWLPEHNSAFKNILQLVAKITQNKHFDQHLETRIVCDASNTGLGAALEQHSAEG